MRRHLLVGALIGLFAASAFAVPIVDGTRAGDAYGAARSVQTIETGFGDNFSELDAGYGTIQGGRLYLMLTGNIEANFNKLEIFIDSKAGGENTLSGAPGNDGSGAMTGLTFDSGFSPDYHLIVRRGNDFGNDKFDVDFGILGTALFDSYQDFLVGSGSSGSGVTGTGVANASPIEAGYDGTNVLGVGGAAGAAADQAAAAAVQTGLELSIALSDLGAPAGDIQVLALQNNQGHDFASNQFLGGLPVGFGNVAGLGGADMNLWGGNQWFNIPEPGTLSLLMLGGLALLRRRS